MSRWLWIPTAIGRTLAEANGGTDGGSAFTRPSTAPAPRTPASLLSIHRDSRLRTSERNKNIMALDKHADIIFIGCILRESRYGEFARISSQDPDQVGLITV